LPLSSISGSPALPPRRFSVPFPPSVVLSDLEGPSALFFVCSCGLDHSRYLTPRLLNLGFPASSSSFVFQQRNGKKGVEKKGVKKEKSLGSSEDIVRSEAAIGEEQVEYYRFGSLDGEAEKEAGEVDSTENDERISSGPWRG
jgi:hypothetical protein